MINRILENFSKVKRLFQEQERLKAELATVTHELEQLRTDRSEFIASLYRSVLQREPSRSEVTHWLQTNLNNLELLKIFTESDEYKQLIRLSNGGLLNQTNNYYGVLANAEKIKAYLLYPSFDKVQLYQTLFDAPFQLSDFISCMSFLRDNFLIDLQKKCLLDIGANIGSTSIYALKCDYFSNTISIEPSASNYQFLILNTKINDLVDRIYPLNYGIADFIGERNIVCSPTNCGDFRLSSSGAELETEDLFSEKEFKIEKAKFTTLDDLAEKNILSGSEIGLIWIDCQGSEGLIFKGGRNLLQQISVPMYIEFWPYGINQLRCKENYFKFIQSYSSQIFGLIDNKINAINSEFLFNFYDQHVYTGQHFDILLIPN